MLVACSPLQKNRMMGEMDSVARQRGQRSRELDTGFIKAAIPRTLVLGCNEYRNMVGTVSTTWDIACPYTLPTHLYQTHISLPSDPTTPLQALKSIASDETHAPSFARLPAFLPVTSPGRRKYLVGGQFGLELPLHHR